MTRRSSPSVVAGILLGLTIAVGTCAAANADVIKMKYEVVSSVEQLKMPEPDGASSAVPVEVQDVGRKAKSEPTSTKAEETFVLGTNMLSSYKTENEETQYDFKNKRIRLVDNKTKTYVDVSLYPVIGFRDAEMQNRMLLSKVLEQSKVNIPAEMFDAFSISSDLGVMPPGDAKEPEIEIVEKDNTITFKHGGKTVTEVTFSDTALDDTFANTYGKAILYKCKIHPLVWKQIQARKKIIDKLSFAAPRLPGAIEHISLKLLSTTRDTSDIKIPDDYKRKFDSTSPLYTLQEKVILPNKPIVMPTKEAAVAEAKQLIKDKQYVDAFLTMIEYSLATGDGASDAIRTIREEIGDNVTISRIATLLTPKTEEDAKEFLEEFDEIEKVVHKKGYVIEIFKGNLAQSINEPADKMFLKALHANPLITGAYKDLGESYESQWQMDLAWDCFDIARTLCPTHPLLKNVEDMERILQERHPEYF